MEYSLLLLCDKRLRTCLHCGEVNPYLLIKGQSWYGSNICPSSLLCTSMRFHLSMGVHRTIELFILIWWSGSGAGTCLPSGRNAVSCQWWELGVKAALHNSWRLWLCFAVSLCAAFSSLWLHVTIVPISCASLQGITPAWKGNTCILSRRGLPARSTRASGSCIFVPPPLFF